MAEREVLAARQKKIRKLTEVSRALTYAMSLAEVLDLTVTQAVDLLETTKGVVMLVNRAGLLKIRASYGVSQEAACRFCEPLTGDLGNCLQDLLGIEGEEFLGVPLVVGGQVTGVVAVWLANRVPPTEEKEWLLSALADQAAVALEKAQLDEVATFRERLIGIVSHDLRAPITAILVTSQSLLRRGSPDPRALVAAARIEVSAQRTVRMVRDLLDYTQINLGAGLNMNCQEKCLDDIVRRAAEEVGHGHPGRIINLRQHSDMVGEWDEDRILQVIENLLSNALNYSPAHSRIDVVSRRSAAQVTVEIHNEGEPIPIARLPHIFAPMQRGVSETSSRRSVGLGLYIVKHIVEAHQGRINVCSSAQSGTTFTVELPVQQAADPP